MDHVARQSSQHACQAHVEEGYKRPPFDLKRRGGEEKIANSLRSYSKMSKPLSRAATAPSETCPFGA